MEPVRHASDVTPELYARARATLLQVAVTLGDLLPDVVLVGGLVPAFLVPPVDAPDGTEARKSPIRAMKTHDEHVAAGAKDICAYPLQ